VLDERPLETVVFCNNDTSRNEMRAAPAGSPAQQSHSSVCLMSACLPPASHRDVPRLYLEGCLARLNALDPECTRCFGTRARLSYSLGQVARQRQQYELSLRHFADVCEYAAERFRERTGFLELAGPPDATRFSDQDRERMRADPPGAGRHVGVHERRLRQLIAELGTEHDIGKRLGRQRKP